MIETDRLILRPYVLADFDAYWSMAADPEVHRFLGPPLSAEAAWNRLLRYAGHWHLLGYGMFAVIDRTSGGYLGETGLADVRRGLADDDVAAWVFSTAAQGRGIAFEAAAAAHRWHEAKRRPQRTVCLIHPDNAASIRLAGKLGYERIGECRYREQPVAMFERLPR